MQRITFDLIRAIYAADDGVDPPAAVIARAKAIARAPRPAPRNPLRDLGMAIARLVYDSRVEPALAGFRDAGNGAGDFSVGFESGRATIDLDSERERDGLGWHLIGQVDAGRSGPHRWRVALFDTATGRPEIQTRTDAHGVFTASVPPGRYETLLHAEERTIMLPGIELP